jgi:hypothetical protein
MKEKFDLVISINVHEKPDYFLEQLQNINKFVNVNKKIILNCNDYMYNELLSKELENTIINPTTINKSTFHGSLTQGIISNMNYALNNFDFEYFLVMSSREFFYNSLTEISEIKKHENFLGAPIKKRKDYETNEWWYPSIRNETKLFKFLQNNEMYFSASAHEGMCFTEETCQYIINFMRSNPEIEIDTYEVNLCVEEFACQSMAVNSKTGTYYYLGNGCCGEPISPNKLTYKRHR